MSIKLNKMASPEEKYIAKIEDCGSDHLSQQRLAIFSDLNHAVKLNPANEIGLIRTARQSFKECTEEKCNEFSKNLEEERQQKLYRVTKIDSVLAINREMLNSLQSLNIHTNEIIQQTLIRCHSLSQQIAQPVKLAKDVEVMETTLAEITQEIRP